MSLGNLPPQSSAAIIFKYITTLTTHNNTHLLFCVPLSYAPFLASNNSKSTIEISVKIQMPTKITSSESSYSNASVGPDPTSVGVTAIKQLYNQQTTVEDFVLLIQHEDMFAPYVFSCVDREGKKWYASNTHKCK